jgi:hypothetical protein
MIVLVPDNEHYTLKKRLFFKLQKGPFGCKVTPQLYIYFTSRDPEMMGLR